MSLVINKQHDSHTNRRGTNINRSQDNEDMQLKWKTFKDLTNPRPKVPKMFK